MFSTGGKFPGEEGWGDFKATRQEKLRETSPLVTFLIYAILTMTGGVAGSVATVLMVLYFGAGEIVEYLYWTSLVAAVGFVIGAGWTLKSILASRHRLRKTRKRRDDQGDESE